MIQYFALSDIHGREVTINDFEERGFDQNNLNHYIVLVGDYFDRHPHNIEVLEFIETMIQTLQERFILIKGNHDEFIMDFLNELDQYEVGDVLDESLFNLERWLRNGGRITIEQLFGEINGTYTKEKYLKKERLQKFLAHLKDYYETERYIFTHAAINEERVADVWNRTFFHEGININKTVIIGHTTFEYLEDFNIIKKAYDNNHSFEITESIHVTKNTVYDIDNGEGNNICVFTE